MTRTFVLALLLAGMPCAQAVELPRMFSDGMVLQRGQPIPIWGRATPGAKVAVAFDGHAASAVADAKGAWRVMLPAREDYLRRHPFDPVLKYSGVPDGLQAQQQSNQRKLGNLVRASD